MKMTNTIKQILKRIYFILRRPLLALIFRRPTTPFVSDEIRSILVIRLDRIGDLVLTTPIFELLRKSFPTARIDALVRHAAVDILRNNPAINAIHEYRSTDDTIRQLKGTYDLIIDPYMGYPLITAILTRKLSPRWSLGFDDEGRGAFFTHPVPLPAHREHFVLRTQRVLAPLGILPSASAIPSISIAEEDDQAAQALLGSMGVSDQDCIIVIHPGGFYPSQRWPAENFLGLINALAAKIPNVRIFVIGTALEKEALDLIARGTTGSNHIAVLCNLPLNRTVAILARASLFIGNNSGIVHIAAALKIPTVSTMGPTIPWEWHPYGDPSTNIIVNRSLPCSPCSRGICEHHTCMKEITIDDMMAAIDRVLQ
jgi:ADP-heptose:LPS heptosyltransferase